MIVVFGTHLKNDDPAIIFHFFQNSDFLGFSKFINKCQKEILRCAPPRNLHMCKGSSTRFCVCFFKKNVSHVTFY